MNRIPRLAVIGVLLAFGAVRSNAQTTNVALQINIALTGFKSTGDTSAVPVRISTKDVITDLSTVTSTSFGANAKLVLLTGNGGGPTLIVRDKHGTNVVNTDVTSAFTTVSLTDTVRNDATRYGILAIAYTGSAFSFSVDGFATRHKGKISARGIGTVADVDLSLNSTVAGSGNIGGDDAVLRGTINAGTPKLEED